MGAAQNPWESLRIHGKWSEFMENVEDPWEPLRIHGNFSESMESPQHPWELLFLSPFWHFSPNSPFPSSNPIFFSHFPSTRSSLSRHRIPGNFPMDGFNCLGFCPFLVFSLDTFAHLGSVWNLAQAGKNVKKMNCSDELFRLFNFDQRHLAFSRFYPNKLLCLHSNLLDFFSFLK